VKKVILGKSKVEVSALAMGTDLIGSRIDRETSFRLFDFFHDNGGTLIDTGNMYACWLPGCVGGESENTVGQWMKDRGIRDQIVLSTKVGFDYPGCAGGLSAAEIQRECEKSLKRLQTDRIDLYYAHCFDPKTPIEKTMEAFDGLIKAGKVRAVCASNLPLWRIAEANAISRLNSWVEFTVVEQRYTYLRPRHGADFGPQIVISEDLKDYARSTGIALIGYSILLQGAYTRSDRPMPTQFAGIDSDARLATLKTVASEAACSPGQAITAWMRQSDPAILPIIAGSTTEQLRENIAGLEVTLTQQQMDRLNAAGNPDDKQGWIQPS
jgi:aryl-alcohol dehydrogenase-like predicted oxidoreductase